MIEATGLPLWNTGKTDEFKELKLTRNISYQLAGTLGWYLNGC